MNFKVLCRYCHQESSGPNYICNCKSAPWISAYRTLYIEVQSENLEKCASDSFDRYSFSSPRGMLQYQLLPNREFKEDQYPTVGLTPFYELDNLSRHLGTVVHLKDEGFNPSGCFKDRETMMCLLKSKDEGRDKAVIYSSGNAAASAAHFAEQSEHQLIAFVPGDTYPEKIGYIRNHGADVIVIGDQQTNFEEGYELFSELNEDDLFTEYGFDNWSVCNPYRVEGDKTIALEIVKQLSAPTGDAEVPDFVLVPTANGSCLAGIWKGFKEMYETGVIQKLPKMVSVGINNANPTAKSVRLQETKRPVRCDISQTASSDIEVGSIIVAERGYDSMEAAEAVIESGGRAIELNTSDIQQTLVKFLELEGPRALKHNILPEPAGMTSLAGITKLKRSNNLSASDTIVSVSTGDGVKAQNIIHSLMEKRPDLEEIVDQIVARKEPFNNGDSSVRGQKNNVKTDVEALRHSFLELQN